MFYSHPLNPLVFLKRKLSLVLNVKGQISVFIYMSKNNGIQLKSITQKAFLSRLVIGMPGNTRQDPKITGEVITEKSLGGEAGKWMKQRFPKEAFYPFIQIQGQARTYNYFHSLPYSNEGYRIVPVKNHFDYMEGMRKFRQTWEETIDSHFCKNYDRWIEKAKDMHGPKWNATDYPGCDVDRQKFAFEILIEPIPTKGDFRLDIEKEILEEYANQMDARVKDAVKEANKDLWRRLIEPVKHMHEKLKEADAQFRNSLIGNIQDIVRLIPSLNLTEDEELEAMRIQVKDALKGVSADDLRDDEVIRSETAKKCETLIKQMEGYFV